jgi:hypothetical protein
MKKKLIMFCMSVFIVGYALPAIADVKIGGIIFADAWYEFQDKENSGTGDDAAKFNVQIPNITRLYGKWNSDEKDVGMWIELGLDGNGVNERGVVTRHACGWWQVNPLLKITAGQTVTGLAPLLPQQMLGTESSHVNSIGGGFGDIYSGRVPQVRFTLTPNENFQIDVAFSDPNITSAGFIDVIDSGVKDSKGNTISAVEDGITYTYNPWGKKDSSLPRIDISAIIKAGPLTLYPGIMYANKTFTLAGDASNDADDSITTYIISMGAKANFGPVCIKGELNFGQNWGNQDFLAIGTEHLAAATDSVKKYYGGALAIGDDKIEDTELFGGWIDAGITVGAAEIHTIIGIQNYANDMEPNETDDDFEQTVMMYGFSVPVKVAKNFKIRPEIMYYDLGERENYTEDNGNYKDVDRGSYVIAGAQFQITF